MTDPVTPPQTPPPAFDPKAIEQMVQGAVRTSIESLVKEGQAKQAELDAEKAAEAAKAKQTADAGGFGDLFKPALEPALQTAKSAEVRAILTADAMDFYTANSANPQVVKHWPKIKETVAAQAKRGNLISHKDAWNWLRGGELYDDISKETLTAHEQKLKEAQEATAAGPSITAPKFSKPIENLNTDELGEALKGVNF